MDKYQGQQNDYVLLSLVRTRAFGHLRDVRRLVVAMSRARLGLYVFGRAQLFGNCYELQPTFRCGHTGGRAGGRGRPRVWRGGMGWGPGAQLLVVWTCWLYLSLPCAMSCVAHGQCWLVPTPHCDSDCQPLHAHRPPTPRRQLLARPTQLCLLPQERYGTMARLITEVPPPALVVGGPEHMATLVAQMAAGWQPPPPEGVPPPAAAPVFVPAQQAEQQEQEGGGGEGEAPAAGASGGEQQEGAAPGGDAAAPDAAGEGEGAAAGEAEPMEQ